MIAQLPNTRMPEERPKANTSSGIKPHKLKLINIKLIELMKKPKNMKTFSANCANLFIGLTAATGLRVYQEIQLSRRFY
jgi:hypothetical protein